MGEMRRGARRRRGVLREKQADHSATSWHSTRSTVAFFLENRFPLFRENALTMGQKKLQCRRPAETVGWS